LIVLTGTELPL